MRLDFRMKGWCRWYLQRATILKSHDDDNIDDCDDAAAAATTAHAPIPTHT